MKALQVLLNNDLKPRQPLQLFSKLRELKEKEGSIKGVALVESDEEDDEEAIKLIQDKLNLFKEQKAREVADVHNRTKESIESIVLKMKDDLQYQALCIINPIVSKNSVERREKPRKEMGSTLPGSVERSKAI